MSGSDAQSLPGTLIKGDILGRGRMDHQGLAVPQVGQVINQAQAGNKFKTGRLIFKAEGDQAPETPAVEIVWLRP